MLKQRHKCTNITSAHSRTKHCSPGIGGGVSAPAPSVLPACAAGGAAVACVAGALTSASAACTAPGVGAATSSPSLLPRLAPGAAAGAAVTVASQGQLPVHSGWPRFLRKRRLVGVQRHEQSACLRSLLPGLPSHCSRTRPGCAPLQPATTCYFPDNWSANHLQPAEPMAGRKEAANTSRTAHTACTSPPRPRPGHSHRQAQRDHAPAPWGPPWFRPPQLRSCAQQVPWLCTAPRLQT